MPAPANGVRLAELLCAVSLATDLGTGQAPGHGLRTAAVAVGLARHLALDERQVAAVCQVALLRFLGCTADASDTARMVGGDEIAFLAAMGPAVMGGRAEQGRRLVASVGAGQPPLRRVRLVAGALADPGGAGRSLSSHCEVAALLAGRLGLERLVVESLAHGYERWDGAGHPDGLAGDAIPLPVRIAVVARDADLAWRSGPAELDALLRARRGRGYDPAVVDAVTACGRELLSAAHATDPWPAVVDLAGDRVLEGEALDRALAAVGDFADLKSPWLRGHCGRVAGLAVAAGAACGLGADRLGLLRRAALVADVGRVGVPNGVWDRPGPLGVADWERVRLHPYLTERTFARCPSLAAAGRLAGLHHERMDGSGYHRGASAAQLEAPGRLLAVADAVAAMGEARPYRPALSPAEVSREVAAEVREGRLDAGAAEAVLAAAGHRPSGRPARARWPFDLTDREVEVLRLIARSRTNREVAAALHLSPKTVGRHVENIYAKIGVSSRAAAALVAMQHDLLGP